VQAVTNRITQLGQAAADLPGVTQVYSFAGERTNLIAIIRVTEPEQLTAITNQLLHINGVLSANTNIAFQHYSNADIQAGFSLGFTSPDRNSEHEALSSNLRNVL
jgi:DNA-binding Lrp family transcriptional regulator